ncbi:hypothetical protein DPV78_003414 [Talaromyces pinophilus]|nr:hypothetical protein DPV78_003414 [Talaromyces pinophilus]
MESQEGCRHGMCGETSVSLFWESSTTLLGVSEVRIPPVESMDPMLGLEDAERGTEIANRATENGEAHGKAVAGIGVADQSRLLSRLLGSDEDPVIEQERFQGEAEETAPEDTKPRSVLLEDDGAKSDMRRCPQPTRQLSNSPSPSLQLQQDLSDFIARLHVSTSPRKDDQQQSNESRSHIIKQSNRPRKRKNTNDDECGTKRKPRSGSKQKRSQTRTIAGTQPSPLNEAKSIRLNLLRILMIKTSQSFDIAILRQIYEMGDRIIYETNIILNSWNEWLSRQPQAPVAVLPAYKLSSAEICIAAYRLLVSTHEIFHRESVYRRLAQVLLHIFVPEIKKAVKERQDKGEGFLKPTNRKPVTIAHDLIVENVNEFERNGKKPCRENLVNHKNFGKRWWRLGNGIGLVVILTCSSDLATSHMKNRSFSDAAINLLVNYVRNAYPGAVAHFQSLDSTILRLITEGSLSADDIVRPYPFAFLRFETLPENIQWTRTESAMGVATEKFLRSLGRMRG